MNYFFVILLMMFLSACGGGVSENNTATTGNNSTPTGNSVGALAIDIQSAVPANQANAKIAALAQIPQATFVRIVLSNQKVKYNNQAFKQIKDIPVGSSCTFDAIPAASGYSVEVISYVKDGALNRLLKYAKDSVNVAANITNTVTLAPEPIQATLNAPTSINSGARYTVSTTFSSSTPLQASSYILAQLSDITSPIHKTGIFSTVHDLTAPTPFESGTLYFQGEYFINASLLNAGESYQLWTFNSPNPQWGDLPVSSSLIVPAGTITITVPPVI